MKQIQACPINLTILMILLASSLFPSTTTAETHEERLEVISVQGSVQVRRVGETQWKPVRLDATYHPGDMFQVLERSRVAFVLSNKRAIFYLNHKTVAIFLGLNSLELITGAVYVLSRPSSRLKLITPHVDEPSLKLITPYVHLISEETEFWVEVGTNKTDFTVFEGQVTATNQAGSLIVTSCQSARAEARQVPRFLPIRVCPRDAVQWALYYPPILDYRPEDFQGSDETDWQEMVRESIGAYREGDLKRAFDSIGKAPEEAIHDPHFFTYHAVLLLSVGRVEEATKNIKKAQNLDPSNSHALALQSIIFVVQNKKKEAIDLANEAIKGDPNSASAWIALSFAQQANFELKKALASLREAVKRDSENALAWARLAELWLSFGDLDKALEAAKKAENLNPNLARTQTVLGFAYLTQIKTRDSKKAFEKAIQLDQADPLPRLGLGLAKIREGDLEKGRSQVEIAASLDSGNSLVRSYLGKAYYEEKHDELAREQLDIARELDPFDPTPWFYDAIRKQTRNRPVEALQDLGKSIELNNNRAVYRSQLLLDEDLAARNASLAQIYNDLGFQQLALVEGWKSLNVDPSNYSAHRFLADSYSVLPRHEIARSSELLQSQLLQPTNINPIQPQLAESNRSIFPEDERFILRGAGLAQSSFNEFNLLFNRNRFALQADGIVEGNNTLSDEVILFGLQGKVSYSVGQFHYKTDGFRENNDLEQDIYNMFAQVRLSHKTSFQAEYRSRNCEQGDLLLRFDPDNFLRNLRQKDSTDSIRLGIYHAFKPYSDIIASVTYQSVDFNTEVSNVTAAAEANGYIAEVQHLFRLERFNIISGAGHFSSDRKTVITISDLISIINPEANIRNTNLYGYLQIHYPENITWTLGGSGDFYKDEISVDREQFNPKLGLTWNLFPATTLRMAVFRTLKRPLLSNQTLEITQVAGFNQFFDDANATKSWRYGIAIDQQFSSGLYGGVEFSKRDLMEAEDPESVYEEHLGRAYLYWTPYSWLVLRAEWLYEQYPDMAEGGPLKTHQAPFGINFFHPSGFTGRFNVTYRNQAHDDATEEKDQFWLVDASISYHLPKRWGLITFGVRNLFDEEFKFQDTDPNNPSIQPARSIFARVTLTF